MPSVNSLSFLGRMGYWACAGFWPLAYFGVRYVAYPWKQNSDAAAQQAEFDALSAARKVDPDTFNPFTPVPYHNNPELNYAYAHIDMRNYVNKNHINEKEYLWKNYNNSYDHGNKKTYQYNFTKVM